MSSLEAGTVVRHCMACSEPEDLQELSANSQLKGEPIRFFWLSAFVQMSMIRVICRMKGINCINS